MQKVHDEQNIKILSKDKIRLDETPVRRVRLNCAAVGLDTVFMTHVDSRDFYKLYFSRARKLSAQLTLQE